jgi:hypothetical protein
MHFVATQYSTALAGLWTHHGSEQNVKRVYILDFKIFRAATSDGQSHGLRTRSWSCLSALNRPRCQCHPPSTRNNVDVATGGGSKFSGNQT